MSAFIASASVLARPPPETAVERRAEFVSLIRVIRNEGDPRGLSHICNGRTSLELGRLISLGDANRFGRILDELVGSAPSLGWWSAHAGHPSGHLGRVHCQSACERSEHINPAAWWGGKVIPMDDGPHFPASLNWRDHAGSMRLSHHGIDALWSGR